MKLFLLKLKKVYLNLPIAQKININSTLIVIIFIVTLAVISNQASSNIIIKKTIVYSIQNLELVNQNIASLFDNVERMSNILVSNPTLYEFENETNPVKKFQNSYIIKANFDNILEPRILASRIIAWGMEGSILSSFKVNEQKVGKYNELYQSLNNKLEKKWNPILWKDLHSIHYDKEKPDTECISLIRNIIDSNNGNIVGHMAIDVDEDTISKIYSKIQYGKTGKFIIVNGNGEIVSSKNKDELHANIGTENYFEWIKNNDRSGEIFHIDNKKYLVSSCKFNRIDWYIIGIVPLGELTGDSQRLSMLIYIAGVICIALATIVSVLLSRTISGPITKLSKLMNNAGEGQLDVRINIQSNDEIGTLAKSFNRMLSKISSLMYQVYSEQKKKREYELIALQAQINPHFLYNTLECICSMIKRNLGDDALNLVQTLAKFYRMVLNKGENIVSIKHEVEIITQYLVIQKIRYIEQLEYLIDIDDSILDKKIIKLSIQPIVENAIYHGIKNKGDTGKVTVLGKMKEGEIIISVIDDGIGMDEEEIENLFINAENYNTKKSFGLRSVDERIKLFFGNQYGVKISSQKGVGTKIDIILPAKFDEKMEGSHE